MAGAEMASGSSPTLSIVDRVATITLARPQVANRLELEDLKVLRAHLDEVNARTEVLVLRLTASGRSFCAGFNITQVGASGGDAGVRFEELADAIEQARPVTVAALQGGVYGGASDLALACDFRLGAIGCELVVPAARLGLHYYRGGLERYVALLGPSVTRRVMLFAEKFDGPAMLAHGMIDRLLPSPEALAEELEAFSRTLAGMAPLSLLGMKKHIARIARGCLDPGDIAHDIAAAQASQDLLEGAQAWQHKRAPIFHGR